MSTPLGENATIGVACLGITHPHTSGRVKALQRIPNIKLMGIVDDSPLASAFATAFDQSIRSKSEVLEDPDVHAVLVHSKSDKMAELAVEALEAGKAVLVEKPAGRNSDDARRLVNTVESTQGLLQVGYCWRFSPAVEAMQRTLSSGQLGKVLQVRAHGGCSHDEAATSHMNQPGDIGGTMFVIGCHLIDRILYHFGKPKSLNARIMKFDGVMAPDFREDAAGAVLNYPDKVVVIDFFSWDPMPWLESWDITAYGTEGVMQSCPLPASYRIYDKGNGSVPHGWSEWSEGSFPQLWADKKTEYSPELAEIGNPVFFDREAAAFVHSIRTGAPSVIPAKQALAINQLIEAMFESSKNSGAEVLL